jgi:hypothetical protein
MKGGRAGTFGGQGERPGHPGIAPGLELQPNGFDFALVYSYGIL